MQRKCQNESYPVDTRAFKVMQPIIFLRFTYRYYSSFTEHRIDEKTPTTMLFTMCS